MTARSVAIPSNQVGNFHLAAFSAAEDKGVFVAIPSNQVGNFHQYSPEDVRAIASVAIPSNQVGNFHRRRKPKRIV